MTKPRELVHFFSKVAGVSHDNADGSSRQAVIRRCKVGEKLVLDHEEDDKHDPNAVRVCRAEGAQLGFLKAELAEEVVRLSGRGYLWAAFISDLTGGTRDAPTRGVNLVLVRAAPGVGREKAQRYMDEVVTKAMGLKGAEVVYDAELVEPPPAASRGRRRERHVEDDQFDFETPPRRRKAGGCAGVLLAALAVALATAAAALLASPVALIW